MSNNNPYQNNNYNNVYGGYTQNEYNFDEPYDATQRSVLDLNGVLVKAFAFMCIALIVTAGVAMYVASNPDYVRTLYIQNTHMLFIIILCEFAMVFLTQYAVRQKKLVLSFIGFFGYSIFTGITLSWVFIIYDIGSISNAFFVTAALFLLMAAYGLITKRDMDSIGDYAIMALLGIILASFMNSFIFHSSQAEWLISVITVVIFVCLTAYDTWKIKRMQAICDGDSNTTNVIAVYGAMELYLDFINIFLRILRLLGRARD